MKFRDLGLLISSVILLILSITIPFLSFLIWFALAPFLMVIRTYSSLKAFCVSLPVGIAFFCAFLFWIIRYEFRIFVIVLVLVLPLFSLFALLTRWLWRSSEHRLFQTFAPPLAWSSVSFLYGFTPIDIIGDQIAIIQAPLFPAIVRIAGISGITFLILLSNSLLSEWMITKRPTYRAGIAGLLLALVLGTFSFWEPVTTKPVRAALVQHNFPFSPEWRKSHGQEILSTYEKSILDLAKTVDLIVFPQYGLPVDVLRKPEWLSRLAQQTSTAIVLATYIPKTPGGSLTEGPRTDSALLFVPGRTVQEYQAVTPPPFRNIGQVTGTQRKPLILNSPLTPTLSPKGRGQGEGLAKLGIMLCYEDTKPQEARLWVKSEAEILLALSNPAQFMGTPLPRYHLLHDRIRAIETGRYVIRVSPNGFSAVIDPNGQIITKSKLNEKAVMISSVFPSRQKTIFTHMGQVLPPISTVLSLILFSSGTYGRDSIKRLARKKR